MRGLLFIYSMIRLSCRPVLLGVSHTWDRYSRDFVVVLCCVVVAVLPPLQARAMAYYARDLTLHSIRLTCTEHIYNGRSYVFVGPLETEICVTKPNRPVLPLRPRQHCFCSGPSKSPPRALFKLNECAVVSRAHSNRQVLLNRHRCQHSLQGH